MFEEVSCLSENLIRHIDDFCKEYDFTSGPERTQVSDACAKLRQEPSSELVSKLSEVFTDLVEAMLSREVEALLGSFNEGSSTELSIRTGLSNLVALGLEGGHMCKLLAAQGTINVLLNLCLEKKYIRPLALRALATVCCVTEAIRQLEKVTIHLSTSLTHHTIHSFINPQTVPYIKYYILFTSIH